MEIIQNQQVPSTCNIWNNYLKIFVNIGWAFGIVQEYIELRESITEHLVF